jgi:pyruvate carboxylase
MRHGPPGGVLEREGAFADACLAAGLVFVGPSSDTLRVVGNKTRARAIAQENGVPVLRGSDGPVTLDEAGHFLTSLGPGGAVMLKAVAGGGGRGMRLVSKLDDVDSAYARCQSEAARAFGDGSVYVEEVMPRARHVEVQIAGDGAGAVSHLWERDCTVQRRHQKLIEVSPSPALAPELRERILADAIRMASGLRYEGLGTFEFLIAADTAGSADGAYAFIEANARLQVEHTVTEELLDLDLVRAQLLLAQGHSLARSASIRRRFPPRGTPCSFASTPSRSALTAKCVLPAAPSLALAHRPARASA